MGARNFHCSLCGQGISRCANKGAQDGSQECLVFFVWSGYFKMCQ